MAYGFYYRAPGVHSSPNLCKPRTEDVSALPRARQPDFPLIFWSCVASSASS